MIKYVIGIDEVGRGPLLGPVAVGVVVIDTEKYEDLKKAELFWAGKDSKKLTEKRRKESFAKIQKLKEGGILNFGVFFESNTVIDKYGIAGAIKMAIAKGLKNLQCEPTEVKVMLDGGLRAPKEFEHQESIIRGDESELVISLASIVAKVTRDEKMEKLAETISRYDLKGNKGYGTAKHINDLKTFGPCELHRRSFIKKLTKEVDH